MINSQAHKMIRLLYKKQSGLWYLASMETSDGLEKLVSIPVFDFVGENPHRQHIARILGVLAEAQLGGGSVDEVYDCGGETLEVIIEIKASKVSKSSQVEKYAIDNHLTIAEAEAVLASKDPDRAAHNHLQAESRERLATFEGSRAWLSRVQARLADPSSLQASGPVEPGDKQSS